MKCEFRGTIGAILFVVGSLAALPAGAVEGFVVSEKFSHVERTPGPMLYANKITQPPTLDGDLADPAWEEAAHVGGLKHFVARNYYYPATQHTQFWLGYDQTNLYVAAECMESAIEEVHDHAIVRNTIQNWVAASFDPDAAGVKAHQFFANATTGPIETMSPKTEDGKVAFQAVGRKLADRWTIEMIIPFSAMNVSPPRAGQSWGFDFRRQRSLWANPHDIEKDRNNLWYKRGLERTLFAPESSFGGASGLGTLVFGTPEEHRAFPVPASFSLSMDRVVYSHQDGRAHLVMRVEPGNNDIKELSASVQLQKEGKALQRFEVKSFADVVYDAFLNVEALDGNYQLRADLKGPSGETFASRTWDFRKEPGDWRSAQPEVSRVEISVPNSVVRSAASVPMTTGVPFPKGVLFDQKQVRVLDATGKEVPVQTIVRSRYHEPDGSIQWLGLDFDADLVPEKEAKYTLEFGSQVQAAPAASELSVQEDDGLLKVDTGALRFEISKKKFVGISRAAIQAGGSWTQVPPLESSRGSFVIDEAGTTYSSANDPEPQVVIEESGSQRLCIAVKGWHVSSGPNPQKMFQYIVRIYAYRGQPYVRLFHTFVVTADTNKTRFADIGLDMPIAVSAGDDYRFGVAQLDTRKTEELYPDYTKVQDRIESFEDPILGLDEVRQGQVVKAESVSLLQHRPHRFLLQKFDAADQPTSQEEGGKSAGWFRVNHGAVGLTVSVKDIWQTFPKELEVASNRMTLHFWPAHGVEGPKPDPEYPIYDAHKMWFCHSGELLDFRVADHLLGFSPIVGNMEQPPELLSGPQPMWNFVSYWTQSIGSSQDANAIGVAKTHEVLLHFHPAASQDEAASQLAALNQKWPHALPAPQWNCDSGTVGPQWPVDRERFADVEEAVERNYKGNIRLIKLADTYGMWNYGDSFTKIDTQEPKKRGGGAIVRPALYRMYNHSHYHNQTMAWLLYMRSGDPSYLDIARAQGAHSMDVDICHYRDPEVDETKRVGGTSHCKHYVHWRNHSEVTGHNVGYDYMLWSYLFEGNRRALDVIGEWRKTCSELHTAVDGNRESVNDIYVMAKDYMTFRTPVFLPKLHDTYKLQTVKTSYRYWLPWLMVMHQITGDPAVLKNMTDDLDERIAGLASDDAAKKNEAQKFVRDIILLDYGYAYLMTRDKKYVAAGIPILKRDTEQILKIGAELRKEGTMSYLDAVNPAGDSWYKTTWLTRNYGVFLRALVEAGMTLE